MYKYNCKFNYNCVTSEYFAGFVKSHCHILISILLLIIFVRLSWCCASGGKKGKKGKGDNNPKPNPDNGQNPKGPNDNPNPSSNPDGAKNLLGDGVTTGPYDSTGFKDAGGGPISLPEELNCDFSSPCCWRNEQPPEDTLDWVVGEGEIDMDKFQKNFKTADKPTEKFLILSTNQSLTPTDSGEFSSCSIECTKEPVKITVRHWTTDGVQLQVCTKGDFFTADNGTSTLNGCQDMVQDGQPGPSTYSLPPGDVIKIVIVAKNFVDPQGGAAIIDDIKVEWVPCNNASTTATPGGGGECGVVCNFESGTCSFLSTPISNSGLKSKQFTVTKGQLGNKLTGVRKAAEGDSYAGVELGPSEQAALASNVNLSQDRVIKFQTYDSTDHIVVEACCDSLCSYRRGRTVKANDREWKTVGIKCPKGTQKFTYTAVNSGYNYGAVGLDDVQLLNPSGDDPNSAGQSACGPAGAGNSTLSRKLKRKKKIIKRIRKVKKIKKPNV